ncbi:Deoxyhypusine hydroxylase [Penicillium citrinum]|uniref:Deoxyhypusine hydroxylase n=1 Tax=Penicillium citrinum TaxID=5077 RepID=A0A9W9TPR6_PENCI|nr:Deoxyhypusine hydroxylase [Penicillium citrinum]KAJ5234370.1 Deoxyhypusine hydroxylase [Penicillium citrinum]
MAPSATESENVDQTVLSLRKVLPACNPPTEQTLPAIQAIAAGFASSSALLKHELAYCLGQTLNRDSVAYLQHVVKDVQEDAMCRHEAAEALGALGFDDSLDLLKKLRDDENELEIIRETCDIAVDRIIWENSEERKAEKLKPSDFTSIDPAPPMPLEASEPSIPDLEKTLLDTKLPLFQRYRAMFGLLGAINALAKGLSDPSALFRHEIAFVFGQLCHPASIPCLTTCLSNTKEEGMVRHEAAEALGSLGDEEGVEDILKKFLNDPEQVVRDSVIVALDMAEFEKNGEVEYALIPEGAAAAAA